MPCRQRRHSWADVTMEKGLQAGIVPCHMPSDPSWCAQDCFGSIACRVAGCLACVSISCNHALCSVQPDTARRSSPAERPSKYQGHELPSSFLKDVLYLQARLRMTKKQRDVLVEQTEEARKQVAELRAERSVLAARLQVPAPPVHPNPSTRCACWCKQATTCCWLLVC